MQSFHHFVPPQSVRLLQCWIDELDTKVVISSPRRTKLGDFKVQHNRFVVSINNNLNPYSFLITLTHEIAHAFIWRDYKNHVKPHGKEWKDIYRNLMLNFLNPDIFPQDILRNLSKHLISPSASTTTDIKLYSCLRKYNNSIKKTVSDVQEGEVFFLKNQKKFIKGPKLRKRFKCIELVSQKTYMVHPLAEIFA